MSVRIRQLGPDDAAEVLQLLRQAVEKEPFAFVTSPEDDFVSSADDVRQELGRGPDTVVFGAFDQEMVGMLWFARESRRKLSHKALIWRAFVKRESRGRGIGRRLLETAIAHARTLEGLAMLWLGVCEKSSSARRLYERLGFKEWGIEPDCMRYEGESARLHYLSLRIE